MASGRTWGKRIALAFGVVVALVAVLIAAAFGYLVYLKVPQSAAGITAKAICSGAFVAGRDPNTLFDDDVIGASPILNIVAVKVDEQNHSVTAKTLGMFNQTASLQPDRGCVLGLPPDPNAVPYQPSVNPAQWPEGDAPLPQAEWPEGVDAAALNTVVQQAFVGSGDIAAANARGVAVIQNGKALVLQEAPGFQGIPLHGWSMTKSVAGMLAYKVLMDNNVPLDRRWWTVSSPVARRRGWLTGSRMSARRSPSGNCST